MLRSDFRSQDVSFVPSLDAVFFVIVADHPHSVKVFHDFPLLFCSAPQSERRTTLVYLDYNTEFRQVKDTRRFFCGENSRCQCSSRFSGEKSRKICSVAEPFRRDLSGGVTKNLRFYGKFSYDQMSPALKRRYGDVETDAQIRCKMRSPSSKKQSKSALDAVQNRETHKYEYQAGKIT